MKDKAEAWRRIRDLRILGKLKIEPVEEIIDVQSIMDTTRRETPRGPRHTVTMITEETQE